MNPQPSPTTRSVTPKAATDSMSPVRRAAPSLAVARAGLGQAVLSAYQQSFLTQIVLHYGLEPHFVAVAGLDNPYAEGKAARGRRLLEELGWAPGQVLLVGDTDHDWEVAQALGVSCVLFPSGHQHPRRLQECGVPLVQGLEEVLELLDL